MKFDKFLHIFSFCLMRVLQVGNFNRGLFGIHFAFASWEAKLIYFREFVTEMSAQQTNKSKARLIFDFYKYFEFSTLILRLLVNKVFIKDILFVYN